MSTTGASMGLWARITRVPSVRRFQLQIVLDILRIQLGLDNRFGSCLLWSSNSKFRKRP